MIADFFDSFMYGIIYMPFIRIVWITLIWAVLAKTFVEQERTIHIVSLSILSIIFLIWAYSWPIGAYQSPMHQIFGNVFGPYLSKWVPKLIFLSIGVFGVYFALGQIMDDHFQHLEEDDV